jgi:hypothetical protein
MGGVGLSLVRLVEPSRSNLELTYFSHHQTPKMAEMAVSTYE